MKKSTCATGYLQLGDIPDSLKLDLPLHHKKCLIDGELIEWKGESKVVWSPILLDDHEGVPNRSIELGSHPLADEETALRALAAAKEAYNSGQGEWPSLPPESRIAKVEEFLQEMIQQRETIVKWLVLEIAKPIPAALKEFDRTIEFLRSSIEIYQQKILEGDLPTHHNEYTVNFSLQPIGVVLCMGPFNYPLNETLTSLIPALLVGNTVVFKPPRHGVLLHTPLLAAYQNCFPKGVVNVVFGSGKSTITPIMKTGDIDGLAFIGSSASAKELKKHHPHPHRLRSVLGLEAKNAAIVLENADLPMAAKEIVSGAFTYNGQRCTAIKIIFVHRSIAHTLAEMLALYADQLKVGMPWDTDVSITPLGEQNKADYLTELLHDALDQGAEIINSASGARRCGNIFYPTIVANITSSMRLFKEEQFGPLLPIVFYENLKEVTQKLNLLPYGQQVSLFSTDLSHHKPFVSDLSRIVARINLNTQCQRGPDELPFTGRRDSAEGTISIADSITAFTIPVVIASKENDLVMSTL